MSKPLPSLFISHGSPMLALEDVPTTRFLRSLSAEWPKPDAIVIASAHWETPEPMLSGTHRHDTIHDFRGFPAELYTLTYHAPGHPELAESIKKQLGEAGIHADLHSTRGLDHGAWNPLLLMYPEATIPVIALSIQPEKDARWHYRVGQAIASLREKNILIIGTGNLTHNLREAFRGDRPNVPLWVSGFARWVEMKMTEGDIESLLDWENRAPYAKENHPTPEHFLPLFIALGAAGAPLKARLLHDETMLGVLAMDAYAFG